MSNDIYADAKKRLARISGQVGGIQKMIDDKYVDEASGTKFNEVAGSGFKGYDPDTDKEFDIKDKSESVYF